MVPASWDPLPGGAGKTSGPLGVRKGEGSGLLSLRGEYTRPVEVWKLGICDEDSHVPPEVAKIY